VLGVAVLSEAAPRAVGRDGGEAYVQAAVLEARGGGAGDGLGFSLAASPDGSTIVAGAPSASVDGHAMQGAVYVFVRGRRGWRSTTQTATLTIPGGAAGDLLGISVAVSDDGSTIIAGAQDATVAGRSEQGAAYVFRRPAAGWSGHVAATEMTAAGGAAGDFFGTSVGISGDGSTIAVAADRATVAGTFQQGAVYVLSRPAGGWASGPRPQHQRAELVASNGGQSDYLGYSIAISSDGSTILAGAPFAAVASLGGQGAAYVFARPGGGWGFGSQPQHEAVELTAGDGVPGDALGVAVATSSNGSTLAAGAVGATVSGRVSQGALYAFAEPSSGSPARTETAKLTAGSGGTADFLGGAVAVSRDGSLIDGGAPGARASGHAAQGVIELFDRPSPGWLTTGGATPLTDLAATGGGHLGASVALADRGAIVVAGAPGTVVSKRRGQGALYVFVRSSRASSATAVACRPATVAPARTTSCAATVTDTRDATASGLVEFILRPGGSRGACRLRRTRSAGVASCRLSFGAGAAPPGPLRLMASYRGDALDLPSTGTRSLSVRARLDVLAGRGRSDRSAVRQGPQQIPTRGRSTPAARWV
jgi:FG-GAP repeat